MGDMKLSETILTAFKDKNTAFFDKNKDGLFSAWELRLARNAAFRDAKKAGNSYTKAEKAKIRQETNVVFKSIDKKPVNYFIDSGEIDLWLTPKK